MSTSAWWSHSDLALAKARAPGQPAVVGAGAELDFVITVRNEGAIAATGIVVSDYLPAGTTLIDPDWTLAWNVATRTVSGPLLPGDSIDLPIRLRLQQLEGSILNIAEITAARDADGNLRSDLDSTPGNAADGEDDRGSSGFTVSVAPVRVPAGGRALQVPRVALLALGGCGAAAATAVLSPGADRRAPAARVNRVALLRARHCAAADLRAAACPD